MPIRCRSTSLSCIEYHLIISKVYRNVDDTMREADELLEMWKAIGITPDKEISFYCGTGWRASETWLYAFVLGFDRVSVYDGGWFEWSSDPVRFCSSLASILKHSSLSPKYL